MFFAWHWNSWFVSIGAELTVDQKMAKSFSGLVMTYELCIYLFLLLSRAN